MTPARNVIMRTSGYNVPVIIETWGVIWKSIVCAFVFLTAIETWILNEILEVILIAEVSVEDFHLSVIEIWQG